MVNQRMMSWLTCLDLWPDASNVLATAASTSNRYQLMVLILEPLQYLTLLDFTENGSVQDHLQDL